MLLRPHPERLPDLRPALASVRAEGWAVVRHALGPPWRERLLADLDHEGFLALPQRIGGVRHLVEEVAGPVRRGDGSAVGDLAAALEEAVTAAARPDDGLEPFAVNQAVFLRYRGRRAGIGPHVDGKCYVLLVAIVTLQGGAAFSVLAPDRSRRPHTVWVGAGDLCLLRAPGFGGRADGRPRHAVGPPLGDDDRVALTLRMRARMGLSGS